MREISLYCSTDFLKCSDDCRKLPKMFRRVPKISADARRLLKNGYRTWILLNNETPNETAKHRLFFPLMLVTQAWEMVLYAWNLCSQSACVRLGRYKNPLESAQEREAYRLCVYDSWRGKAGWSTVQRGTKTIDDRLGFYQLSGPQQHWKFNYYMSTSSTSLLRNLLKSQCFRIAS